MNAASAYGASKQYTDINKGTLESVSWGAINGDINNQSDLITALTSKRDSMKKMKQDFESKWGNITLCGSTLSAFNDWLTYTWEKYTKEGEQEFVLPYAYNLMVQVFIDKNDALPIKWSMNNKWYAMGVDGIVEVGENDFIKKKLGSTNANKFLITNNMGDVVTTEFDNQIIDCGTY